MKKKMVVVVMVACVLIFSACGNDKKMKTSDLDTNLVIGLDDTFAPMGFRNEKNELVGFDVELAQEIAKIEGWQLTFQPIDWSMKEQELKSGNIDMIWNGYTITEERKKKLAFSDGYLANRQIIVVLADSEIEELSQLADKTVALQAESSALDALQRNREVVESLKEIPEYATNTEVFRDLEVGRADAIVVDEVMARYYMKSKGEKNYRVLAEDLGEEEFGVGLRKEDQLLLEGLNKGLNTLKENGKYQEIYEKWFSKN